MEITLHTKGGACIPWSLKPVIAKATKDLTQYIKTGPPGSSYRDTITFYYKDTFGLWVPAQYICSNDQWMLSTKDARAPPTAIPRSIAFRGALRDAQADVCRRAIKTIRATSGTVLVLPTGFGKTVCALYIALQLGVKPLVLVHKSFLMEQWSARLASFLGPEVTISCIQGAKYDDSGDIVIAMMQTMFSRGLTAPEGCGLTIVDECHHVPAKTFRAVMMNCNTKYRLGLSATPERADGLNPFIVLGQATGLSATVPDGINAPGIGTSDFDGGRIHVRLYEYSCPEYSRPPPIVSYTNNVNHAAMLTQVACDTRRTKKICQMIKTAYPNRNILCLVHRKSHAQDMLETLTTMGVDAGLFSPASGGVCPSSRVVIATYVFASEGFDEKRFDTLVLCSPATDVRQAVGRILRKMDDPRHSPLVVDIVDAWAVFNKQAYKRRAIYRTMGCTIHAKDVLSDVASQTFMFRPES